MTSTLASSMNLIWVPTFFWWGSKQDSHCWSAHVCSSGVAAFIPVPWLPSSTLHLHSLYIMPKEPSKSKGCTYVLTTNHTKMDCRYCGQLFSKHGVKSHQESCAQKQEKKRNDREYADLAACVVDAEWKGVSMLIETVLWKFSYLMTECHKEKRWHMQQEAVVDNNDPLPDRHHLDEQVSLVFPGPSDLATHVDAVNDNHAISMSDAASLSEYFFQVF